MSGLLPASKKTAFLEHHGKSAEMAKMALGLFLIISMILPDFYRFFRNLKKSVKRPTFPLFPPIYRGKMVKVRDQKREVVFLPDQGSGSLFGAFPSVQKAARPEGNTVSGSWRELYFAKTGQAFEGNYGKDGEDGHSRGHRPK